MTSAISGASSAPRGGEPIETIDVHDATVACDGGAGSSPATLGHPLVYLTIGKEGSVDCPYCGRHFVLK